MGVPSPPPLAISLSGVVKRYGAITAVAGLDLEVPEGSCVGLLGPNGAGKSTTMKMLTAQAVADEGRLVVLGHVLPEQSKMARAEMGVVPQLDNLDTTLSVRDNLRIFARLYRVPAAERRAAVQRALEIATLTERADTRADKLSGGMRRRLLLARGLVHDPELLLLDEPTVGLDPQIRTELWTLIDGLRTQSPVSGSRLAVGSSSSSSSGRLIKDFASATRVFCPAESWPAERPSSSVSCSCPASSAMRRSGCFTP